MVTHILFLLWIESPNTSSYVQMTMQELCSALNQENAREIKAILEVMLTKLLPEVMSKDEKKNVQFSSVFDL